MTSVHPPAGSGVVEAVYRERVARFEREEAALLARRRTALVGCAALLIAAFAAVRVAVALGSSPLLVANLAIDQFAGGRVQDSLARGESYFLAEVLRLKALVDAARCAGNSDGRCFVYLIDEIFQGTNSVERRIAGRRIVRELLRRKAIGAVSTHDLSLVEGGTLEAAAWSVHFTETPFASLRLCARYSPGFGGSRWRCALSPPVWSFRRDRWSYRMGICSSPRSGAGG